MRWRMGVCADVCADVLGAVTLAAAAASAPAMNLRRESPHRQSASWVTCAVLAADVAENALAFWFIRSPPMLHSALSRHARARSRLRRLRQLACAGIRDSLAATTMWRVSASME